MPASEEGDERLVDRRVLADDARGHRFAHATHGVGDVIGVRAD
jgi:hypothetical protein